MSLGTIRAATATLRRFRTHCGGSLTIPAIFLFAILMGVGGLAIDLQRLYGVHGQMQAYVDDAALAGAGELDGQTNALTRATRAIVGEGAVAPLVTGTGWQKFATDTSLSVQKITFLSALDTDPGPIAPTPAAADNVHCTYTSADNFAGANCSVGVTVASANGSAKFVEVVAAPRTVSYVVLPVADVIGKLFGAANITSSATLALRATAGFKQSTCDINPLMICNPSEPANNADTNYPYTPAKGAQILIRAGGGAAWTPGAFGWVDVPDDAGIVACAQGGHQDSGCVLGLVNPLTQCFNDQKVNVSPGQANSTAEGLNVRFDIYPNSDNLGPAHGVSTDSNFAPSVNVTKGVCNLKTTGGNTVCDYKATTTCINPSSNGGSGFSTTATLTDAAARSIKLPRDTQWSDSSGATAAQPDATHRFGNGTWDKLGYWKANHCPTCVSLPANFPATRYLMYRHEIDCTTGAGTCFAGAGIIDGIPNFSPGSNDGENGNHIGSGNGKYCSNKAGINTPLRDRRMLIVAVVNCHANSLNGGGGKNGVTAVAWLKVFLTEPIGFDTGGAWVGTTNAKDVYGEVIDVIKPNDQSHVVHVYPVLYR